MVCWSLDLKATALTDYPWDRISEAWNYTKPPHQSHLTYPKLQVMVCSRRIGNTAFIGTRYVSCKNPQLQSNEVIFVVQYIELSLQISLKSVEIETLCCIWSEIESTNVAP